MPIRSLREESSRARASDNKDETFAWLQKCYDARSPLTTLKVDPMYDPLRSDPRFQKFLHGVRLTQ